MLPLQLQPESHVPLYIQVRDQIRALVHTGELRVGDRIPASRELAAHLGVHRTTVANAYAELESEGLIHGHVGRGTFVLGSSNGLKITPPPPAGANHRNGSVRWESLFAEERVEEALGRLCPVVPRNTISFSSAKADDESFPLDEFRNCCAAVMKRDGKAILQLGPSDGYAPLKASLREILREDGITARDEQVLITSGCQQSLDLLCKAFLRPGDSAIVENPAYPGAMAIFAGARVHCLAVPVHADARRQGFAGLDVDALEAALVQNRVKLIVLTPDFQNPTGTTLPVAARRRVLEIAGKHQVPIVEDHIYARLRFTADRVPSLKALDRNSIVIQVDSFSKFAFPGLRVGWMVAPESVIERLRQVKQATDLHTDQLAQAALAEFTRRGYLKRHLARVRKIYRERLLAMHRALEEHMPEGATWTRPDGGMCLWLTLPAGLDASDVLIRVRERGVLFAPGRYFYFQNPSPNTLRLVFASQNEKQIARGIEIFGEVLRNELRQRQRGVRSYDANRVAFI
jgi:DNA-binding transcriptional MocR family regulator